MESLSQTKIELGCGKRKSPGYIGVDRFPLPEVDVVADLNETLPFQDDSVDVVLACHSLEHLNDLCFTMNEVFRICKHRALIYVLAPYYFTTTNIANPYHKITFNESTFQFFSNFSVIGTKINPEDFYCPHAANWGLGQSDNSVNRVELTSLSIEFFYYKEYAIFSPIEKRHARRSLINVCDQIYYVLAVNKSKHPFSAQEIQELMQNASMHEPERFQQLRNRTNPPCPNGNLYEDIRRPLYERMETLSKEQSVAEDLFQHKLDNMKVECSGRQKELAAEISTLYNNLDGIRADCSEQQKELAKQIRDLHSEVERLEKAFQSSQQTYMELWRANQQWGHTQSAFLLDVLRSYEQNFSIRLNLYRKKNDITATLQPNYEFYVKGVQTEAQKERRKSILCFSKVLPYATTTEYPIYLHNEELALFFVASYSANLLIEIVKNNSIVFQKKIVLKSDGIYQMDAKCLGAARLRLRTLDSISIVRVLERCFRKYFIRCERRLAYFSGPLTEKTIRL